MKTSCLIIILPTIILSCVANVGKVKADDDFVVPTAGYCVDHYLTDQEIRSCSMIDSDSVLISNNGWELKVINLESGDVEINLGQSSDSYFNSTVFSSFAKKDPNSDSYWVGYTVVGNGDDRIYEVSPGATAGAWIWTHRATCSGNYDLEFYGDNMMIVSANGGGKDEEENALSLLDVSGNDNHTIIANTGGFSAGLSVSSDGIYYATYHYGAEKELYYFSDQAIQAVLDGGPAIELSEAEKLASLSRGASDTAIDSAGHVVVNVNYDGEILLYDETQGEELTSIATAPSGVFLGTPYLEGDLLSPGGSICVHFNDYIQEVYGIAKVTKLIPGDANEDGMVDGSDVTILANNWQKLENAVWADGDFNGDGAVDGSDVTILANNWQKSLDSMGVASATVAVPEPGMLLLVLTAFAAGWGAVRWR